MCEKISTKISNLKYAQLYANSIDVPAFASNHMFAIFALFLKDAIFLLLTPSAFYRLSRVPM